MVTEGAPVTGYVHPRRLRAVLIWALADTGIGAILVLGSPARVSSHAFDPAKSIAPMHYWGIVALVIGLAWLAVCSIARQLPWPAAGYAIGLPAALMAGWHAFFWMSLCFAIRNPVVGLLGVPVYAAVAATHVLFAVDQV